MAEETQLVESFPKPPRYFECFHDKSVLSEFGLDKAPSIPVFPKKVDGKDINDVYDLLYGGSFSRLKLSSMSSAVVEESYGNVELKAKMQR